MFNVKWGVYSGGAAFILALLTSLLFGHAGFLIALLRALIFAVIFFGLGTGAWALINNHIPELLFTGAQNSAVTSIFSGDTPGARVNITLGDTSGVAIPEAGGASSAGDLGDIGDLISGKFDPAADAVKAKDIDQNPASGYNIPADLPPAQDAAAAKSGDGDFSMDFSSFVAEGEAEDAEEFPMDMADGESAKAEEIPTPERKVTGNKPTKFDGDFNPKEIAAGIRTVLEKDKKG